LIAADAKLSVQEIEEMIFLPGFTTAETVNDISGRGLAWMLCATISIVWRKRGNCVAERTRRLLYRAPAVDVGDPGRFECASRRAHLHIAAGKHHRIGTYPSEQVSRPVGGGELFSMRNEYLPLIRLYQLFGIEARSTDFTQGLLVIVEATARKRGYMWMTCWANSRS